MCNKLNCPDYEPTFKFYKLTGEKNNMFFGIELELESEKRYKIISQNKNDFFYFKRDYSLDSTQGVEIVSHPATLDYHLKSGIWDKMFEDIQRYELTDSYDCGMHIHVNRNALEEKTIASLDYVVNNFSDYMALLGGRNFDNEYFRKIYKSNNEWGDDSGSRYCALNIENERTIEFRFFQATANKQKFYENIKIVYSLIEYCKKNSVNEMLEQNKKESSFIIGFLALKKELFK